MTILRLSRLLKPRTRPFRAYHTLTNERSLQLLRSYDIPTPSFLPAYTPLEASRHTLELSTPVSILPVSTIPPNTPAVYSPSLRPYGVATSCNASQSSEVASTMLSAKEKVLEYLPKPKLRIESPDARKEFDGREGKVLVSKYANVARMFMLAITVDRKSGCPMLILSRRGHLDLESHMKEERARHAVKFKLPYDEDVPKRVLEEVQDYLKLNGEEGNALAGIIRSAYRLYKNRDVILLEINPFALLKQPQSLSSSSKFLATNARVVIDSSTLYRNTFLLPHPSQATIPSLAYITLPDPTATIGTVVNGAGLAMATNDTLWRYGGHPINFCDFGGRADQTTILESFRRVLSDQRCKVVLVNVYGGITQGDMIAEGIIQSVKMLGREGQEVPVVVRLAGTGSKEGLKRIKRSGLAIYTEESFEGAARLAVGLSKHGEGRLLKREG